jgi:hypothetical protein
MGGVGLVSASTLRLDGRNVLRCAMKRARGAGLDCDTPVARPDGTVLVIRCRNCHTDHAFGVADGKIVPLEPRSVCRLPQDRPMP